MDELTPQKPLPDDPILGAYVSHHPSNRTLLLLRGGVIYALGVVVLQVLFLRVDDRTAAVLLPVLYAAIAAAIYWYILHLWNREVVLYSGGFTYRRGSQLGAFPYANIASVSLRVQRVSLLGRWGWMLYDMRLLSDQDEQMRVTNLYTDAGQLCERLERAIARARKPIAEALLARGEALAFGDALTLDAQGIAFADARLAWADYVGFTLKGDTLRLNTRTGDALRVPLAGLPNAVLLVAMLKERAAP